MSSICPSKVAICNTKVKQPVARSQFGGNKPIKNVPLHSALSQQKSLINTACFILRAICLFVSHTLLVILAQWI
jgi:hypothetical protein